MPALPGTPALLGAPALLGMPALLGAASALLAALVLPALLAPPPAMAQPRAAASTPAGGVDNDENQATISQATLVQLTNGFADRYMTYIVSAADAIEKNNPNTEQRRLSHRIKLVQISAIYDIVTNPDPFTQLLDLTLVVSLQARKWIDDDLAERWFGPRGRFLVAASRQAREEIWKIAARVMRPSQLEQLDALILDWHRKNRHVDLVSYVRFDDFAASRSKSIVAEVAEGGGFLAPVSEATKAVDEVRVLAERALFLGKRMPFLLNWQVRDTVSETLSGPELGRLTELLPSVTNSLDRVSRTVARVPEDVRREREAVDQMITRHGSMVDHTLGKSRELVRDSIVLTDSAKSLTDSALSLTGSVEALLARLEQTSGALRQTIETIDTVFLKPGRDQPRDPNEKPFDIGDYARTAVAVSETIDRAQRLMGDLKTSLDSPQLAHALEGAVDASLGKASNQTAALIDQVFWRAAALLVLAFVLALIYRLATGRRPKAA
ncbi:MAG: hypothetical protein AB7G13_12095 [Lautropia sp.]